MRYQKSWKDADWDEIDDANQANLEATIHRSLELGINHIETARGYGSSERQLGRVLPTIPREKLIIQTKVGPTADSADFYKTFNTSMERLGLEHVELLSLHGINDAETLDWSVRKGGCIDVARQIQREGRAKFIGFSTHAPNRVIVQAIKTGEFDYVNLHWYFVNDFNWAAVEAATRHDMGVFIISPNDKGGKLYEPPAKLVELCEPLSPMQFNDLYCLSRPEVHTLSVGASRPSDFDDHIAALEHYDHAAEVVAPIETRLREQMVQALGEDWCKGWWDGVPEYLETPNHINILEIGRLWTFAKSLDLVEWGKMRYNLLGNAGHWFPGTNSAAFDEETVRKVLAGSAFEDRLIDVLREANEMMLEAPKERLSAGD